MSPSKKEMQSEPRDAFEKPLGEMLRQAREDQGLDYGKLSEITKLRPFILESLEEEKWDTFSAPVFIKGFLRSYANALRLDVKSVLQTYEKNNPGGDSSPRPLSSLKPARKRAPLFFVMLIILAALAFLAVHFYTVRRDATDRVRKTAPQKIAVSPVVEPEKKQEAGLAPEEKKTKATEMEMGTTQQEPTVKPEMESRDKPTEPGIVKEAKAPLEGIPKPGEAAPLPVSSKKLLILRADVKERTWVKIITDQGKPKEYIFRPGSHPEWKAHKGFEVFIGNAGGVVLEFNGKKLNNLGGRGKVIHLKLSRKDERN